MFSVEVDNLYKSYGEVEALSGVSMKVREGELFGLIGPDGAGKSTLFRIMATLLLPDRGSVLVNGFDIKENHRQIRSQVGYMPGRFSLYLDLSVKENLTFYATIFGTTIKESYHIIEDIYKQIEPFSSRKATDLSGGMKQKLALCCALIHRPKVLFLDEPTTGVDPVSRREFWQMLKKLQRDGITIIVSTPYMDEAGLCDRIALIEHGRFLTIESPGHISDNFSKPLWRVKSDRKYQLLLDVRGYSDVEQCWVFGEYHHFILREDVSFSVEGLLSFLKERGHNHIVLEPIKATIEDSFMLLSQNATHG